jgi:hypothetical protein
MKKMISILLISSLLIFGIVNADSESTWSKYVTADKSLSFHYPSGWKITSNDSVVVAENQTSDEQLIMAAIPFDNSKSPQELADGFLTMLKNDNPNVRAFNWRSQTESEGTQVMFDLVDNNNGKEYSGLGYVIKLDQQALWFSYFAPTSGYYQVRGFNILQGFIDSITYGSASQAPGIDYSVERAEKIDRNSKAFMFVLEFALGAPFTQSQENVILDELKNGWRYISEEELQQYDLYPIIVQGILTLEQKELEELRVDLEKSVNEWLVETDQSDQAVKLVNDQLKSRGQIVIDGEPPLTEMSLTAYSEIIAYSRLLQQNPIAKPEQISQETVNEIKQQVIEAWKSFSDTDKQNIATAPGLWICLRVQLQNGSQEEQDNIRADLKKLGTVTHSIDASESDSPTSSNSTGSSTEKPMDMAAHWSMMQIHQQTFYSYMWSHGFNYHPVYGKMW